MPVWLQITAVICPALVSFLMGIALIPFLEKYKFCLSESGSDQKIRLRPTMCGILLLFGTVAGLVLSVTLYRQFSGADRTGMDFQMQNHVLWLVLSYSFLVGFIGLFRDYCIVRKKIIYPVRKLWQFMVILLLSFAFVKLLPEEIRNAGMFPDSVNAVLMAVFWQLMQIPEQETDGISITLGVIQFLCMSMLFLAQKLNLYALFSFSAAGSAIGCLFWNLHPAKCKLGHVGLFWLGAAVPALCIIYNKTSVLFLYLAVYVLNFLPVWIRKCRQSFVMLLKESGCEPLQRIAILAGFALFCCILAVITQAK